jgi:hypothetical protein
MERDGERWRGGGGECEMEIDAHFKQRKRWDSSIFDPFLSENHF